MTCSETSSSHPTEASVILRPSTEEASSDVSLASPVEKKDDGLKNETKQQHQQQQQNSIPPDYLRLILTAQVYPLARVTPLQLAPNLSATFGVPICLKREDLQPVFSFKIRGAFNRMQALSPEQLERGVIAVSAGNHAQGVALAAQHLRCPATIVMPECTPSIKVQSVRRLGARVVLHGGDFDEAKRHCVRLQLEHGWTNIPPFDDPLVIAGQGTVAVEMMRQIQQVKEAKGHVQAVFCAVGGGGLVAGVVAYVKRLFPAVKVYGVEATEANAMAQSLKEGRRVLLDEVGLFADGAAVRQVGEYGFDVCKGSEAVPGLDGVVEVTVDEICAAIKDVFAETRVIVEPAGALGVAGLKKFLQQQQQQQKELEDGRRRQSLEANEVAEGEQKESFSSKKEPFTSSSDSSNSSSTKEEEHSTASLLCTSPSDSLSPPSLSNSPPPSAGAYIAITSGANMNFDRLRFVAERARLGEQREALILALLPERPGSFLQLYTCIEPRAVTEFSYRYHSPTVARILLSFEVDPARRSEDVEQVLERLQALGFQAEDWSENEVAKSHARYLSGGRTFVQDERLFQFVFPERPGALRKFLVGLHVGWNVSLFHYRNVGADSGKVLVGLQVPAEEEDQLQRYLKELAYAYTEETKNPVYALFLQ